MSASVTQIATALSLLKWTHLYRFQQLLCIHLKSPHFPRGGNGHF